MGAEDLLKAAEQSQLKNSAADMSDLDDLENMSNEAFSELLDGKAQESDLSRDEMDADLDASIKKGSSELDKEVKSKSDSKDSELSSEKPSEDLKAERKDNSELGKEDQKDLPAAEKIEISPETKIEVKIDGKLQEVSLQELKNNYSGKVAFDKKFTQLDQEKKALQAEVNKINDFITDLGLKMKTSMLDGFYKVGELKQIPPHVIRSQLIKELMPEIERQEVMSEYERRLELEKHDLEYKRKLHESEVEKLRKEQANRELRSNIDSIREAHNIDETEWDKAVHRLDAELPKDQEITPRMVGDFVVHERARVKTETALKSFDNGKYSSDEDVVKNLHNIIMQNPGFSDSDIQQVLSQAFKAAVKENVETKVKKVVEEKPLKAKKSVEVEDDAKITDWEQLLDY